MHLPCLVSRETNDKQFSWWEDCSPVPSALVLEPPLPKDYSAWIHRSGWVLYVHEPSETSSWLHPGKLADLQARGAKDRELWIKKLNRNSGSTYVLDYGCTPGGECIGAPRPFPGDIPVIDRIGWQAWKAERDAEWAEAAVAESKDRSVVDEGSGKES